MVFMVIGGAGFCALLPAEDRDDKVLAEDGDGGGSGSDVDR